MLVACGILVPLLGIEPVPPALEAWSPNHRNVREFPISLFLKNMFAILHNECPIIKKFKWFFFFFFFKGHTRTRIDLLWLQRDSVTERYPMGFVVV